VSFRVQLGFTEELAGTQPERVRDALEVCQREILLTALDGTDVSPMHLRPIREDFL
jgi:hypothetical protein